MKDGEHDDFVVLLANFVDDDVGAFDEFVGPGIETEAAIRAKPGVRSSSSLRKIRFTSRCAAAGLSFAIQLKIS
jgi:hypothetical protein